LMSSRAFHCCVVNSRLATQVPNGRRPWSKPGTNATLRCAAPFSFTQCPAVITTLSFPLVTAVPEQEALAPPAVVKNSRPLVRAAAGPSAQRGPGRLWAAVARPVLLFPFPLPLFPELPLLPDPSRDRLPVPGSWPRHGWRCRLVTE